MMVVTKPLIINIRTRVVVDSFSPVDPVPERIQETPVPHGQKSHLVIFTMGPKGQ